MKLLTSKQNMAFFFSKLLSSSPVHHNLICRANQTVVDDRICRVSGFLNY